MQDLIDRIAVVLGEHLDNGDELHACFNSMQSGSQTRWPQAATGTQAWTELFFEYSALLVLRAPHA